MGFLDNSGDIILDAVLTDAGRKRLARGDGTFKITKYAFGDDEIDYGKYQPNHSSGSAYFDLEILQTPILEAFTNNRSSLKSKLISLTNNNLLYLPEIILNEQDTRTTRPTDQFAGSGSFYVAVTTDTVETLAPPDTTYIDGTLANPVKGQQYYIRVDQGLNTTKLSAAAKLSAELTEQQYLIEMDNRLGQLVDVGAFGNTATGIASPAFIDDDQIASYYVTKGVKGFIGDCAPGVITAAGANEDPVGGSPNWEVLTGPRGTKLGFALYAKDSLRQSDYLFDTIGETKTGPVGATNTFKIISTTIRITGVTTGYRIDIPVTYIKKTS